MLNIFWNKASLTLKIALVFLCVSVGTTTLFIGMRSALAANLKEISIVHDDLLKLGDLFDGLTKNRDYVIGAAPEPGQDMTLNARTLYRIAISLDLDWRPKSAQSSITIRREATIISHTSIEETLRHEISSQKGKGKFNLKLNSNNLKIILPREALQNVEVKTLTINPQSDIFHATLVAPSRENPLKELSVTGTIERVASVPVLRTTLRNGDIIGKNDIDWIDLPEKKLQHDILMRPDDLIGFTPRRMIRTGKIILSGELERPQIVKRGESVSITFREGPLLLTAKGKALQSGAKGDMIRVTNMNSSRNIDAFITDKSQVVVR